MENKGKKQQKHKATGVVWLFSRAKQYRRDPEMHVRDGNMLAEGTPLSPVA